MTTTCTYIGPDSTRCTCDKPAVAGTSYCEEHYHVVYAKGTRLGRRLKDQRRAEAVRQLMSDFNQAIEELEQEGFDVWGDSERIPEDQWST